MKRKTGTSQRLAHFATAASKATGSTIAFVVAVLVVVVWAVTGPIFGYLGHLAAGDQHRHHHRHLPDGVPDPARAEQGLAGGPAEAERAGGGDARARAIG